MAVEFPLCSVCFELIELPVTLPCEHELCLACFRSGVETGNLRCPLCRRRISTWARRQAKDPVNQLRKKELEDLYEQFGSKDNLRLAVSLQQEENKRSVQQGSVSSPGDVAAEYATLMKRVRSEEAESDRESEQKALRLQEKETELAEMEMKQQMEQDEKMARELFEETQKVYDSQVALQIEKDRQIAIDLDNSLNSSQKSKSASKKHVTLEKWLVRKPSI